MLSLLRNPYGQPEERVREARLRAADLLELLEGATITRVGYYCSDELAWWFSNEEDYVACQCEPMFIVKETP